MVLQVLHTSIIITLLIPSLVPPIPRIARCALPDSISPSSHSHPDVLSFFLSFPRIVLLGRFLTLSSLVLNPLTSFLCRLSGCGRGCANAFPRVALWLLRYFFGGDPTSPGLGFSHLYCNIGESFPLFRILTAVIMLTLTNTVVFHTHPPIGSAEVGLSLFKGRRSAGAITLTVITESLSHQDKPAELLSLLALSSRVKVGYFLIVTDSLMASLVDPTQCRISHRLPSCPRITHTPSTGPSLSH